VRALPGAEGRRVGEMRGAIDEARLRSTVEGLPFPRVRTMAGSGVLVEEQVLDAFRRAGWRSWLDSFEVQGVQGWAAGEDGGRQLVDTVSGVNVVAVKQGEVPDALIVVAHHDTVPGSGGADDNGSGLVALIELARLVEPMRLHYTVILAAVDHEELGFYGSQRLVEQLSSERAIVGAYVLEMLAYTSTAPGSQRLPSGIGALYPGQVKRIRSRESRGDFIAVIYQQQGTRLATAFAEGLTHLAGPHTAVLLRAPGDLPVIGPILTRALPVARDFARSDHVPFWQAGLTAVQLTDTANFRNPNYHGPEDLPDTLDYARLCDVTAATAWAVERLAGVAQAGR
jgi:Zn-dependent M28 family amino/carboxypeptidase